MNKDNIYNKLIQYYDEFSSEYLANCIFEFSQLFGEKYIKIEEIIELLINNFSEGIKIYDNFECNFDAICSANTHQFKVNKEVLNEENYFKYVLFHEFIHAISFRKNNNKQYMGFYTTENGDDYIFKSKSFNEAFTEYITIKRNESCNYNPENKYLSGYIVGVEQLKLILKIIPEHELVDCYFNFPNKLETIFIKYNMNIDEIFYSFYILEGKEYEIDSLLNKRGLNDPSSVFKIIDSERYLYYNLIDSIGPVTNEESFDNKWKILLSENSKFNLWKLDKIFIYQELINDLNLLDYNVSDKYISDDELSKYKVLTEIFNNKDRNMILKELSVIYNRNYKEYFELVKDSFATLAYTFLPNIINNFHLYDIELYPRSYKYLEMNNSNIDNLRVEKYECEKVNTRFYIFHINDNVYVETNFDDTSVKHISNNMYEVKYGNNHDIFDLGNKKYIMNDVEYTCKKVY